MSGSKGVLLDYTTLVSAANALNCSSASYPPSVLNPYVDLLRGRTTSADSPMWLEMACLADCLEACVLHENILAMATVDQDRVLEKGRYTTGASNTISLINRWSAAGFLRNVSPDAASSDGWLADFASDRNVMATLLRSMMQVLKEPPYSTIPDLFSHSQTVYKFDGESIWNVLKRNLNVNDVSRAYRQIAKEEHFTPRQKYSKFFYPEDILAFFIRGLLYNDLAKQHQVAYHPHAARAILVLSDALWSANQGVNYAQIPINFVRDLYHEIAAYENSQAGIQVFDLDMPPVFAAIIRESKRVQDLPRIAFEIRETTPAREYRAWVAESFQPGKGLKVIAAQRELDELKRKLRLELGLDAQPIGVSLWKISFNVRLPAWLHRMRFTLGEPHTLFIRDIARAALEVLNKEQQLIRIWRAS